MRLRNLSSFVKVARLGSFHAAASQLHASQPTVSARIAALEEELGVKLFSRDKSGTRLTDQGRQLLPYAEKLLAINTEMKAKINPQQVHRGTLRIGIADTLAHLWLSGLLKTWQQQHPQMTFEFTSDVTPELVRQLQRHQLDFALMVDEQQPIAELHSEPLVSYPQRWVASSLADVATELDLASLSQLSILSFPRETRPWRYLQQLFNASPEMPLIHTCSSVASLLALVEQGLGVALLPEPLIAEPLASGKLVQLSVRGSAPEPGFGCCWRADDDRPLGALLAQSGRQAIA